MTKCPHERHLLDPRRLLRIQEYLLTSLLYTVSLTLIYIPTKILSFLIYSGSLFESCDPKYWHGWKFNYYAADHGSSSTSQPHPVLELNERRPVYRNYRLLMNGTLYISKTAEEDEGKFICEADNGVNEPNGKLVALKVNGKYWMWSFILSVYFFYICS